MTPTESWNHRPQKIFTPPIPADEVLAIMQRAADQIGRRCHYWPCMREHQRTREDGWTNLGSMGEMESGQAHQVWWDRERHEGRLWSWEQTPHGHSRPFPLQPTVTMCIAPP